MKRVASLAGLAFAALAAAGCAQQGVSDLLGGDTASTQQAQTYQNLAMPPDLQLHPPSEAANYATQTAVAAPATQTSAVAKPLGPAAQPEGDVYDRNGISKFNADGTPKTDQQLQAELKQVYLAKKQAKNPNYGTVFNIGNIFKDE